VLHLIPGQKSSAVRWQRLQCVPSQMVCSTAVWQTQAGSRSTLLKARNVENSTKHAKPPNQHTVHCFADNTLELAAFEIATAWSSGVKGATASGVSSIHPQCILRVGEGTWASMLWFSIEHNYL